MTEQKEQIPPQIQDWINTEKERLRPSGLDVRVYELGLKDMYRKLDFSALRSENERLKGERNDYRKALEEIHKMWTVLRYGGVPTPSSRVAMEILNLYPKGMLEDIVNPNPKPTT